MLLGFETGDDAAVYQLSDNLAAVLTVDFFTPIVDDPYLFGRIAAANALSDIYAMGAEPKIALNLLALDSTLGTDLAEMILRGGADIAREAGVVLAGGHTIDDAEPKYGLTVFGTAHPDAIIKNSGAKPHDVLYLTKPLGTGIMTTALNAGKVAEASLGAVFDSMQQLNARAAQAMKEAHVHAATDITGFGFAGHLHEMLVASNCGACLTWNAIPLFEGVKELAEQGCCPGRCEVIKNHVGASIFFENLSEKDCDTRMKILCDPQTSGGLLIAVDPRHQELFEQLYKKYCGIGIAPIGAITDKNPRTITFVD